jgi:hypothetical protein
MTQSMHQILATQPYPQIKSLIEFFLGECPTDMIPRDKEVAAWLGVLQTRPEPEFAPLINLIDAYLHDKPMDWGAI